MKPGTKPDLKKDQRVLQLRKKKLSYREISRITKEDVKNVFYRYRRALERGIV